MTIWTQRRRRSSKCFTTFKKAICPTIWEQRIWHSCGGGDGIGLLGLVCTNTSAETPSQSRPIHALNLHCIPHWSHHPTYLIFSFLTYSTFWVGLSFSNDITLGDKKNVKQKIELKQVKSFWHFAYFFVDDKHSSK